MNAIDAVPGSEPQEKVVPDTSGSRLKNISRRKILHSLALQFFVLLVYLVLIECMYTIVINVYFHDKLDKWTEGFLNAAVVAGIIAPLIWQLIIKRDRRLLKQHEEALKKELRQQQLEGKIARAFGMAETEPDIIRVFNRIVEKVAPDLPVELLLVDSSQAHLRMAASSCNAGCSESGSPDTCPDEGSENVKERKNSVLKPMCAVRTPKECLATRLSKSHIFKDSLELDACPLLVDRSERSISAVCEPINVAGKTIGIIHSDITSGNVDLDFAGSLFPMIAKHLGNRLGLIRALNTANLAAMTDPLTGLLNRRSLEDRCASLLDEGRKVAVVVMDIDHFKNLNDTYSHAVGDRSLKAFAKTLQKICRRHDLVARLGGEEFCLVLLDIPAEGAMPILKRIQKELPKALVQAGLPEFTASFGVTDTDFGDDLETLIKIADDSMYEAKNAGRDRIVIASAKSPADPGRDRIEAVN